MIGTLLLAAVASTVPPDLALQQTRLEMRIAEAVLDSYRRNAGELPVGSATAFGLDDLRGKLAPVYEARLRWKDAWGHPLRCWRVGNEVILVSDGPDGTPRIAGIADVKNGTTGDDVVLRNGAFLTPYHATGGFEQVLSGDLMDADCDDSACEDEPTDTDPEGDPPMEGNVP
jgi:hypothetical protein